jgi:hypothetical protein
VAVVARGMMFGVVITKVVNAGVPVDKRLAKANLILDPVKVHLHCFEAFLFDGAVCQACCHGIDYLHGRGWLRMTRFFKSVAK